MSHLSSKFRPRRPNPALPEQRLKQHGVFTASRHLVPWSICIDLNVLYQTDASSPGKLTSHYSQTAWQLGLQSEFGPRITFAGPASNCQLQMVFGWLNGGCARRINTPVSGSVQTAPSEVSSTAKHRSRNQQSFVLTSYRQPYEPDLTFVPQPTQLHTGQIPFPGLRIRLDSLLASSQR